MGCSQICNTWYAKSRIYSPCCICLEPSLCIGVCRSCLKEKFLAKANLCVFWTLEIGSETRLSLCLYLPQSAEIQAQRHGYPAMGIYPLSDKLQYPATCDIHLATFWDLDLGQRGSLGLHDLWGSCHHDFDQNSFCLGGSLPYS